MEVSDIQVLKLYKENKYRGLELLYERYKKYVYTIAFHYAGTKEDALDITQEVFVSLFKSLDRMKEEFSMIPYIKRITVNKCLNFIRDRKEVLSLNKKNEAGDEILELIPSDLDTESKAFYKDTKRALEAAVRGLPDKERMAVILRHVKGMKYEEIARIMDIPLGTVKTFLYRGRRLLKESLVHEGIWEV